MARSEVRGGSRPLNIEELMQLPFEPLTEEQEERISRPLRLHAAQVRREFGAPYWILLCSRRSTSRQRRRAARAIAATMPTKIAHRNAYYALKEAQGHRWLREEIFVPALLEAARDSRRPQYVRIGTKWVKAASGRKKLVSPMELATIALIRRWLMQRAWRIAAKKLELGRPLAPLTEKQLDTIRWAAKQQGVTPDALRKRAARTQTRLAQLQKRWQKGRSA